MPLLARPQETQYFQSPAGRLFYQPAGYVRLAWGPDRLPLETIEAFYEQVLALLQSTQVRRILSDHGQRVPLSAAAQEWIVSNWIPRAMRLANTHHCAIVEGADPMHRLSTQSVVSNAPSGIHFKRFDNFEAADAWLRSLVLG